MINTAKASQSPYNYTISAEGSGRHDGTFNGIEGANNAFDRIKREAEKEPGDGYLKVFVKVVHLPTGDTFECKLYANSGSRYLASELGSMLRGRKDPSFLDFLRKLYTEDRAREEYARVSAEATRWYSRFAAAC